MLTFTSRSLAALALLLLLCGMAHSSIVSGTATSTGGATAGQFVLLTVPFTSPKGGLNTIGGNSFDLPNLYGLNEVQSFTLTASLVTSNGTIAAGTVVNSHYVFFDPADRTGNVGLTGSVTFDGDILGVINTHQRLNNSTFLRNSTIQYIANNSQRGYETGDTATFSSGAPRTLFFNLTSSTGTGDYARVITAVAPAQVPEPSSLILVGLSLAGVFVSRRRRRAGRYDYYSRAQSN